MSHTDTLFELQKCQLIQYTSAPNLRHVFPKSEFYALNPRHVYARWGEICPESGGRFSEVGILCLESEARFSDFGMISPRFGADK